MRTFQKQRKLRVMTILGTRPEIIRLSRTIPILDKYCDHTLIHTGQNYDERLNKIFFEDLGIRAPNVVLDCASSNVAEAISKVIYQSDQVLQKKNLKLFLF